jgi:hypothetical protein
LKRRLARLAKAQQPFNSLVAALAKASTSTITLVESEKLRQLPRLGKAVFNINPESQDNPRAFQMQPPAAQRSPSVRGSLSTPQRLTSALQVESTVARREAALLWVVPRHSWPLSSLGCQSPPSECQPRLLIYIEEPTLSAARSSSLLVVALMTDSRSIVVEPRAEKRFQEASPLPGFSRGAPAARWTTAYQPASAAESKAASTAPVADKPPGAEQPSSDSDDETEWVARDAVFRDLCTVYKSRRASPPLRKIGSFISKPFRPAKKRSFRQEFSGTKKGRPCLDQPMNSILRLRGGSRTTGSGLSMRSVKLLGRKRLGEFLWRSIGRSDKRRRLIKSTAVNHTDNQRCQQFTPTAAIDTALIAADKLPGAEQLSSDDEAEWVARDAVFEVYHQENRNFNQEGQPFSDDETEWPGLDAVFEVYRREYCSNLSQESLHCSMEEQCPPAAMPSESDDPVPERASETLFRWAGFDEERLVAIQRLMHYMVATGCSRLAAETATGFSRPGYESLYRACPPTVLNADPSANSHPIP